MITTSYIFNRKKTAKAGVAAPIEIRITDRRKSSYISTGIKVLKDEWLEGSVVNRNDAMMLNRRLANMINIVGAEIDACILNQKPIDLDAIKSRLSIEVKADAEKVTDWIEKEVPKLHISNGTRAHYVTMVRRLREWGGITFWQDVTVGKIYQWNDWLHSIKKPMTANGKKAGKTEECISDGCVNNYHKCLRAILRRAERMGKIEKTPYDRLQGAFAKGDKESIEYLTDAEIKAFESLHPVPGSPMAYARDLFVWQMHTGMSYSDTQIFDFGICREVNGRYTLIQPRVKTGVEYVVMLDDTCMEILSRNSNALPKMNNSDYNTLLKALGMAAGIVKQLHSHLGRHTFATYMLSHKADITNVSKALGHKNIQQTMRYAKVLPESVFADFEKVFNTNQQK